MSLGVHSHLTQLSYPGIDFSHFAIGVLTRQLLAVSRFQGLVTACEMST